MKKRSLKEPGELQGTSKRKAKPEGRIKGAKEIERHGLVCIQQGPEANRGNADSTKGSVVASQCSARNVERSRKKKYRSIQISI